MKKLSVILASLVLFAGASFATPVVNNSQQQAKTDKKSASKDKKDNGKPKKQKVAKRKPVEK